MLIGYSESALKILKIASSPEFDMFNGNYVWIGTRNWIFDGRVSEAGFPGLIGTMIYVNHSHPLLLEFVESWSQKFRKSPGDVFYVPESFIGILGFDYTLFAGHAISTLIQYNASCFQRLNVSKSLCDLLKNNQTQEELILNCCSSYLEDYGIILSYLLQNLTYRGSSSYLRPDSKDEYVSSALGIVNINNRKKKYVGVFFDGELQMDEKEEAIWQDGTTNIPSDKPDLTEFIKAIPLGVIIPYWVLASFGIVMVSFFNLAYLVSEMLFVLDSRCWSFYIQYLFCKTLSG